MSMLRANSPIPLYLQLYDQLRTSIERGELIVGRQILSERQLAANYGISRLTARRALTRLREEGFICAYQGKGSFVATGTGRTFEDIALQGFTEMMVRHGFVPSSRTISRGIVPVTGQTAHYMQLREHETVVRIRRLRLANNTPIAIHTSYLPYPLCRPLLEIDLEKHSLYRVLQERLNIRLAHADQTARPVLGSDLDLALLDLEPPAAVTQIDRQTYDSQGHVVEYLKAICREDQADVQCLLQNNTI